METSDIEGARPRVLIKKERTNDSLSPIQLDRLDSRMHVKDINQMDNKKKFLYKRTVDPLNPTYKLPEVGNDNSRMIGPIDG